MMTSRNSIIKEIYVDESGSRLSNNTNSRRTETVASQFRAGLKKLMHILYAKNPSYIRCIKPNHFKRAGEFDTELVRHQVKYLSLLENLRVRRAGFAYKKPYDLFLAKYKSLCPMTWPHYPTSKADIERAIPRDGVSLLLTHLGYQLDVEYSLGRSKLFICSSRTFFDLEDRLDRRKVELASLIKALYKGYRQRLEYKRMRRAVVTLVSAARKWYFRKRIKKRIAARQVLARFLGAYARRHEPYGEHNRIFLRRMYAKFLLDLRAHLPRHFADTAWPACPKPCQKVGFL
jgi:myosin-1